MRRLAFAALVAAALLGSSVPAGADGRHGGDTNPCHLLTRKEITAALGQQAGKGSQRLVRGICQWRLKRTAARAPGQVNTLVERGAAATRDFEMASSLPGTEVVDGLGKTALFNVDSGTIFVLEPGPTLFTVQANIYDAELNRINDGLKDSLVQLVTQAEARV